MQWTEDGSLCSRTLENSATTSLRESWVVTQSILRPLSVSYRLNISVELYAEADLPKVYYRTFSAVAVARVYYLPSKGPVGNDQRLNLANYELIGATYPPTTAAYFNLSFDLSLSYDRFYVAVSNPYAWSSSIKLRELRVFYTTCSKS